MLKAVIFDMDGVLIDSEPLHARAAVLAFKNIGVNITMEYCYQFIGRTNAHMLETIIHEYNMTYTTTELLDLYNKSREQLLHEEGYSPIPYTKELIEDLYQHGIKLAIASSSSIQDIEEVVTSLGIKKYFDHLISGTTLKHPKPAPDVFLKAAKELGVPTNECIIIEDSYSGLMAGKAAGIPVIGFANPNSGNQNLSDACIIVEGFEEIDYNYINQIHARVNGEPVTIANTSRLIIRELSENDLEDLKKIYAQSDVNKYIKDIDNDLDIEIEKQKAYIKNVYPFYGYGLWGIYHKETGKLIGRCGIQNKIIQGKEEIELGYLLSKDYWGLGFASESGKAVIDYAFHILHFQRIVAVIDPLNYSSVKVAERIGMSKENTVIINNKEYLLYHIESSAS
jgi:HAD superfamily hydrolase (TIGR01509 family)